METASKFKEFIEHIKDITTIDFFISLLLFFVYFETYIRVKFNVDFFQFSDNPNQYWNKLSDTSFLLLILPFTISILFDIFRQIYWSLLYPLWEKIGIDMYVKMENSEHFVSIFKVKQIAYETNNTVLYDMCIRQEEINKKRKKNEKYKNNAVWGILFFTLISFIHFLLNDINSLPIIIDLFVQLFDISSKSIILSLIFAIFFMMSILWLFVYLFDTLHLKGNEIYKINYIEIGKNNKLSEQIKKSNIFHKE
ncbi:MAG: hypothetical protein IJV35_04025 [Neisseriaceae bacterium]|nr:hypothetical protein [Neisseriaceae bacterium]